MKLSKQSVLSGTIILVVTTFLSNILGIFREVLVAKSYGTTAMFDAYAIAMYVPSTIYAAFFYGMSSVYTPLYYSLKQNSDVFAQSFATRFVGTWIIFSTVLCMIIALSAPLFLILFNNLSESIFPHVVLMTQLLMIGICFNCSFVIMRSLLHANNHFLHPSLATLMYNVIMIGFIILGTRYFSVYAMVYGSIVGMAFQLVYILILYRKNGITIDFFGIGWFDSNIKRSFALAIPIMGIEALWGVFYLIDGSFASHCGEGNVSSLTYASTLFRFPGYLIGMSLSAAILPSFSRSIQSNRIEDLRIQFSKAFRYVLTFSIFFSGIFFLESNTIVSFIYQRGAFDTISVERTSNILKILSFGFFFVIMYPVLSKVFNAKGNNVILLVSFIVGIIAKIIFYVLFFYNFGIEGIVVSMLIGYSVIFIIPLYVMNRSTCLIGKIEYQLLIKSTILLVLNVVLQSFISPSYGLFAFTSAFIYMYRLELLSVATEIVSKIKTDNV